jgi:hypothetical protein
MQVKCTATPEAALANCRKRKPRCQTDQRNEDKAAMRVQDCSRAINSGPGDPIMCTSQLLSRRKTSSPLLKFPRRHEGVRCAGAGSA